MKKLLALLLALLMLLSLAACGKTATDGDNPLAIEQEEPYVEETPPANELDPSSPIPADTGTLALTEQVFEEENLKLMLPEGVTTPDGVTYSAGGITATFPARWEVKVGENGFVTFFHSEKMTGGVNFGTVGGGDPAQLVSHWEGEEITKSYGGLNFNGVIMKNESDDQESPPTYTMRLYGPYSGERTLSVFANLRGFQPEDYKAFLDNEQFADVMNSLVIDPNGYHEPGTASENGFTTDRGQIASYTGSDTALEIPARIGQFDTESIGFRVFAGNTAITSVVIPEGVTVIQPNAFEGCSNLESVTFPDTLMEIDANAFRNVGAEELAAHLGVSRRLVDLRFREILGRSIYEVIRDRRLEEAKRLLRQTDASIASVTERCGFTNKTHLKNLFLRRVGCSMRDWRNRNREARQAATASGGR